MYVPTGLYGSSQPHSERYFMMISFFALGYGLNETRPTDRP